MGGEVRAQPVGARGGLDVIDWSRPWLQPLLVRCDVSACAEHEDLHAALNLAVASLQAEGVDMRTGAGQPLQFVPQEHLPIGRAYEQHIGLTGEVPTRVNVHDVFNAAVWLTFPKTKAVLNAQQFEQIERWGVGAVRGMRRDALTLFDENAAIWVTSDESIAHALRAFDWQGCLVAARPFWHRAGTQASAQAGVRLHAEHERVQVFLFGHALMEKLTAPRKSMCAHTWVVSVPQAWFELNPLARVLDLDERMAQQLAQADLTTSDFCPLPILGVPHFWQDNRQVNFYNDAHVFRAGRTRSAGRGLLTEPL